jgi:hypothetical protein
MNVDEEILRLTQPRLRPFDQQALEDRSISFTGQMCWP